MFGSFRNTYSIISSYTIIQSRPFPNVMFCCITILSQLLFVGTSVLRSHPPPLLLTLTSLPYRECLLVSRRLPKFLNFLSDRVITNTPEMLYVALYFHPYNTDFAHFSNVIFTLCVWPFAFSFAM